MDSKKRIFLAGHRGMVGSAIKRKLESLGHGNILTCTRSELDLTKQSEVQAFFSSESIDVVYLAAAKVGGIQANNTYPADFIYDNLIIECNVINAAHQAGVQQLLFLGSSCIYPRDAKQPMPEEALLTGPLEPTNEPYAVAKIAGIKLCESYNRQHGRDYRSVMPTNLYGPGDNFDLGNSHVVAAMIRKFHLAKCLEQGNWKAIRKDLHSRPVHNVDGSSSDESILNCLKDQGITLKGAQSQSAESHFSPSITVNLWGTGTPRREFMHVDDLASACVYVMNLPLETYQAHTRPMLSLINVGTGKDCTIEELAKTIKTITGFGGRFDFDPRKPDGTPRKLLDCTKIRSLGWKDTIDMENGLHSAYKSYQKSCGDLSED